MSSFELRKLYWTDGNTVNMANMDGSNSKILFQNQKEPVGKLFFFSFEIITAVFNMTKLYLYNVFFI